MNTIVSHSSEEADFVSLRRAGAPFVDKSSLIEELMYDSDYVPRARTYLITRPPRFGKSLSLSMLRAFFDCTQNLESARLFAGLKVSDNQALCQKWQGQYPVIYLPLKNVQAQSFEKAKDAMRLTLARAAAEHQYLLDEDRIDEFLSKIVQKIILGTDPNKDLSAALYFLILALHNFWQKRVIILIDDYDVPLCAAAQFGYGTEMSCFMNGLLSAVEGDNNHLEFAVIAGRVRLISDLLLSLDYVYGCGLDDPRLSDQFGFTESEVRSLLHDCGLEDRLGHLKEHCAGYHFGRCQESLFCPRDVMDELRAARGKQNPLESCAAASSDRTLLKELLTPHHGWMLTGDIMHLLDGGTLTEFYPPCANPEHLNKLTRDLWRLLLSLGFLTKADGTSRGDDLMFKIPNLRMKKLFAEVLAELQQERGAAAPLVRKE